MPVTISLGADGGFDLSVPSTLDGRSHTVHIPATQSGISIIRKVLSEQAKASKEYERKLGHVASPTQAMVQSWLAQDKVARAEVAKEKAQLKAAADEAKEEARLADAKHLLNGINLGELDI